MADERGERRRGDYEILDRLSSIEDRQAQRWQAIQGILDRLSVVETRQAERWETVHREFSRIDQRLVSLEQILKGYGRPSTGSMITLMMQDVRVLLVAAMLLGAALGKAGINPIDWVLG